jgi:ketosteroid isomerase-like protein
MSQENVELARRYYEALNAHGRDFEATEHFRHPEMELYDPPDFPDAGRSVGEAAFRIRLESYWELGFDGQYRVQEYVDAGEEVVVIWQARVRTPHGGGFPVEATFGHVLDFEDGKIRRIRQYFTRTEALEAAGLSE